MAVDGYLKFNTKIDTKGFNSGTKQISSSITSMKSLFGKLGSAISAAFAVKGIFDFGKQAIETASDIQEVQNVVDVSFGSMKSKMEEFADSAIETYGISKLTAKQTGSTYMAMAKGMQIADDAAAEMALTLTGLSADMASFYNKEQSATATALNSVFTGETETLKTYGIVMTEANLQQFAYTQGINKKISAMSQSEKVQLRYNYVLSQTALAQGDFARTSGNWANQVRILKEQWNEFSSVVGTALINIVLPAVRALNQGLAVLISFANKALNILAELFGWEIGATGAGTAAVLEQADALGTATDSQKALTDAVNGTAEAQKRTLAGFDKINKLNDTSSSSSGGASGGSVGTGNNTVGMNIEADTSPAEEKISAFGVWVKEKITAVKEWWNTNFLGIFSGMWDGITTEAEELKTTLNGVFSDINALIEPLKQYFTTDFTVALQTAFSTISLIVVGLFDTFNLVFGDIWNVVLYPLLQTIMTDFLPLITQFGTEVAETWGTIFNELKTIFDTVWSEEIVSALTAVVQIITDVMASMKSAWDTWGAPVFANLRAAYENASAAIQNLWDKFIKPVWDKVVSSVKELWDEHLKPFVDNFLDFVGEFVNGALEIYNKFIVPIVDWFVNKFGPPVSEIFQKVVGWIKNAIAKIVDILNGIITTLKGIVQYVTGVFTGDWNKAWQGIKNIFSGIWSTFTEIVSTPIENIKTLIGDLRDWIKNRWEDIKTFFSEIPGYFEEKFSSAWKNIKSELSLSNVKSYFEDILEGIQNTFSKIPEWFRDKFSDAWQKVKDVFSAGGQVFDGIKDGILASLKSVINGLIRGINNVIAVPFNGINSALSRIREISIAGVQPFANRIPYISVPSIPYLATGTVVPANYGEFLAVLGDNKRETEVVSPLSTIKQALSEVLAAKGDSGDINIVIELDGDVVYKTIVKKNKLNTKRTGVNALAY